MNSRKHFSDGLWNPGTVLFEIRSSSSCCRAIESITFHGLSPPRKYQPILKQRWGDTDEGQGIVCWWCFWRSSWFWPVFTFLRRLSCTWGYLVGDWSYRYRSLLLPWLDLWALWRFRHFHCPFHSINIRASVPSWPLLIWRQFYSCRHGFLFRFILLIGAADVHFPPPLWRTIFSFLDIWLLLAYFSLFSNRLCWYFLLWIAWMVGFMTQLCCFLRRQAILDNHSLRKFEASLACPWLKICQFQRHEDLAVFAALKL